VAYSNSKTPLFNYEQRTKMIQKSCTHLNNIQIKSFKHLLVDFAHENKANYLIRGVRSINDLDYETQLGFANKSLDKNIETIFLMPDLEYSFISSTIVRSILTHNGCADHLLPKEIKGLKCI
jgi:pantetheine-phosphate adenylyltransferase